MSLSIPNIESTIDSAFTSSYGPADDDAEFAKFKSALALVLYDVLTTQAVVNVTVTGVTDVGSPGGPLTITSQPGVGNIS